MASTDGDAQLEEIEAAAAEMARGAGLILIDSFGTSPHVDYKDEGKNDPVSQVDRECQDYLAGAISKQFPDHGIIGEEDPEQADSAAPDYVWVLDPLDGTKNHLAGLPVFASSIGVLLRGRPVVGAVYIPWTSKDGGVVVHARQGAGAYHDDKRLSVVQSGEPEAGRLVALPGSLGGSLRFGKPMRGKVGEARVTGSIAYELALTAQGVFRYTLTTGARLWDVAAGSVLVAEAGGLVMQGVRPSRWRLLTTSGTRWEPLRSFVDSWEGGRTSLQELRDWSRPLLSGETEAVPLVARHLVRRVSLRHRLRMAASRPRREKSRSQ